MPLTSKYDDTKATSILEFLQSKAVFKVPRFQRNYSWTDEKTQTLWTDLMENFHDYLTDPESQDSQYLLGPIVLVQGEGIDFIVIDGQQRLATLTMLFCLARDLILELIDRSPGTEPEGFQDLRRLTENLTMGKHSSWKLTLNHSDKTLFNEIQEFIVDKETNTFRTPLERISKWKADLKNPVISPTYTESMKKIVKNYTILYHKILDSLITNFEMETESDEIINKIEKDVEPEIDSEIRADPEKYELDANFFTELEKLQNKNFTPEETQTLEEELQNRNTKRPTNQLTFDEFIETKHKRYRKPYDDKRKEHVAIRIIEVTKEKRIASVPLLKSFLEHVKENNYVVQIIVKDDKDAFQVFETLNERGLPLSKSNLIKNYILNKVADESAQEELSTEWDEILDKIIGDGQSDDDFIRESLRSRYFDNIKLTENSEKTTKASNKNLYKIIKAKLVTDEASARTYIKNLKNDSLFLSQLNDPTTYEDEKSENDIYSIWALDAKHIRTPILTAYRRWSVDNENFRKLVQFLVKFFFRYRTVSQGHPGKLDTLMINVARKIAAGKDLPEIFDYLLEYDNDDDFAYDLRHKFQPRKESLAKYYLQQITLNLGSTYSDVRPIKGLTLEHILPKNPDEDWKEDDFFKDYTGDEQHKFEKFLNNLGNHTLLKNAINSKIQNKGFHVKKNYKDQDGADAGYNSSQLEINKQTVMTESEWTANIILERAERFAVLAEKIWKLK